MASSHPVAVPTSKNSDHSAVKGTLSLPSVSEQLFDSVMSTISGVVCPVDKGFDVGSLDEDDTRNITNTGLPSSSSSHTIHSPTSPVTPSSENQSVLQSTVSSDASLITSTNHPQPVKGVNPFVLKMIAATASMNGKKHQLFADSSLGAIERVVHQTPETSDQMLMSLFLRLRLPPQVNRISEQRILDLIRLAQAKHYRLASYVDHTTYDTVLFGNKAADLPLLSRFVSSDDGSAHEIWQRVVTEEINSKFDLRDPTTPLWRVAIIGTGAIAGNGIQLVPSSEQPDCIGSSVATSSIVFDLIFTFHHCLGDGLSMLAFARTLLAECTTANYNAESLHLDQVSVVANPPVLLDNYIKPSFFGIVPALVVLLFTHGPFQKLHRFKDLISASQPSKALANSLSRASISSDTPLLSDETDENLQSHDVATHVDSDDITTSDTSSTCEPLSSTKKELAHDRLRTKVRFLQYDAAFTANLIQCTRTTKTTVAAVLIVNALACVRAVFADIAKSTGQPLPKHQGWIATTSFRHLVPESMLLYGADKHTDPATMLFGLYAGSMSESSVGIDDHYEFWERCRRIKRTLGGGSGHLDAIRRIKLLNWIWRTPWMYRRAINRIHFKQMSQAYSVEVANLGAWEYPTVTESGSTDGMSSKEILEWFGGTLSASFEGSRGIFNLGIITLGKNMSIAVSYDCTVVSEDCAKTFIDLFDKTLKVACESMGTQIQLGNMPCSCNDV
ncbi:hypothetical protein O5D80_007329 [Batrachochytrium dendrobatidis]|nr:hypothetical protein O5D80_007329 [Batrachochytrium dendrobatidis]